MSEPPRDVELVLTDASSAGPIANLYPLYLHDIASYEHRPPNRHGVLAEDDGARTWDELFATQATWWAKPGVLFPYLIRVGAAPAGFLWIASGAYVPTQGVDFCAYEFFLAHAWRGTGVAGAALARAFALHVGEWEIATWPSAHRALAFWRRTLPRFASDGVRESEEDHAFGRRVVFRFRCRP
jgi:aminoglycoside 6'-N-acetyltransferase I